jgi:predicted dehydrogenase
MGKIGIGLFGSNGHQVQHALVDCAFGELAAVAGIDEERLPEALRQKAGVGRYDSLDEMLKDDRVQLVSLCSPRRSEQARHAIQCMEAGRDVYAEKPCAMREEDLDAIIATARGTGRRFHEMAGTAFDQPYLAMRKVVAAGTIGTVVQVLAQKSYPYHERRPQDEDIDGGLTEQAGVHALRFVEHVAGVRVDRIQAFETSLGNPGYGELRMASSMVLTLANGGVATVIANYLNPRAFGSWGNETLRIFGTEGFVEAVDGGTRTRLVLNDEDRGPLDVSEPGVSYLDLLLAEMQGEGMMPFSIEDELHPTRMVIRAKAGVYQAG